MRELYYPTGTSIAATDADSIVLHTYNPATDQPIVLPFLDLYRIEDMRMFYAACMADGDTPRTGADVEKTVNEVLGDMMAGRTSKNQAHQIKDAAESRIKKADRDEGAFRATRSRP
jgi:hypothetical protein